MRREFDIGTITRPCATCGKDIAAGIYSTDRLGVYCDNYCLRRHRCDSQLCYDLRDAERHKKANIQSRRNSASAYNRRDV